MSAYVQRGCVTIILIYDSIGSPKMAFLSKAKTVIYFKDFSIKIPSPPQSKYPVLHYLVVWNFCNFASIFYIFMGKTNKKDEISEHWKAKFFHELISFLSSYSWLLSSCSRKEISSWKKLLTWIGFFRNARLKVGL